MWRLKWLMRRPAVVLQIARKLGWSAAIRLMAAWMRGSMNREYSLRIKGHPFPITIRGGKSGDGEAVHQILVREEYAFAAKGLESPAFIIDCGANIGMTSLYFLNRFPAVRVIAIEPSEATFAVMRKNLECFGDRVVLIQGAVWKESCRLLLDHTTTHNMATRVRPGSVDQPGSVQAFTVSQLISRGQGKVDLLKMDVEGSEKEIFGPSAQEWLPEVRNIVIELHDKECSDRYFEALAPYDYDLVEQLPKSLFPVVACKSIVTRSHAGRI